MTIRVLLVDDVLAVRRLVRTALRLRGGFDIVGEASDGGEAVRLAEELQPDIVVLDLGLPDIAGREVLSRVRVQAPAAKVVIFSGVESGDRDWFERQADGYILKDEHLDYLVNLLETVGSTGEFAATLELPRALASVRLARRFVAKKLDEWDLGEISDDALLVASELAANAITHAESECRIRLSLKPASFRIDVFDSGDGTPEPQPASATLEHGRGLHLVAAITSAWGLEVVPGFGKLVWAELARPVAQRPA